MESRFLPPIPIDRRLCAHRDFETFDVLILTTSETPIPRLPTPLGIPSSVHEDITPMQLFLDRVADGKPNNGPTACNPPELNPLV
jgi:hypothetical protein